jgi:hypothetical protein
VRFPAAESSSSFADLLLSGQPDRWLGFVKGEFVDVGIEWLGHLGPGEVQNGGCLSCGEARSALAFVHPAKLTAPPAVYPRSIRRPIRTGNQAEQACPTFSRTKPRSRSISCTVDSTTTCQHLTHIACLGTRPQSWPARQRPKRLVAVEPTPGAVRTST